MLPCRTKFIMKCALEQKIVVPKIQPMNSIKTPTMKTTLTTDNDIRSTVDCGIKGETPAPGNKPVQGKVL